MRPARLFSLALLVLSTSTIVIAAPEGRLWTARYPLAPGGRLQLTNVQGSIAVEGWDRPEVELVALKVGEPGSGEAAIAVERGDDWLSIRTLYPVESAEPVQVDFYLRVPRQVRLEELVTVNGDIRVYDVEGTVAARTLNGDIEQSGIRGSVAARALNGSITVKLRGLASNGSLDLETINGDVRLLLPPRADADLELSTVAGRIDSELRLEANPASAGGDNALRARVGRGGAPVRLRTVRGDIVVAENADVF